jgi:hypothetical protein
MVKVKRALRKVGIEVRTEWGYGGWALAREDKAKLRAMMAGEIPLSRTCARARRPSWKGHDPCRSSKAPR